MIFLMLKNKNKKKPLKSLKKMSVILPVDKTGDIYLL